MAARLTSQPSTFCRSAPGAADRFLEDIRGDSVGNDVDPQTVAARIVAIRDALVRDWSEAVVGAVADEHALVCREALEAQFVPDEDN